jgi:uncharacterized phage protein gp47/JayE
MNIKAYLDILNGMITHMRTSSSKVTDFNVGGIARTLLESAAIELYDFYLTLYRAINEAIPTAVYQGFGFNRVAAIAASGTVSINVTTAPTGLMFIPLGTLFTSKSTGITYASIVDNYLAPGQHSVSFVVNCAIAGLSGNAPALDLQMSYSAVLSGLQAIGLELSSNLLPVIGGQDQESDGKRALRFAAFIKSLSSGTNDSLIYAAKQQVMLGVGGIITESVDIVSLDEAPGHVTLYIQGNSTLTSEALLAKTLQAINGFTDSSGVLHNGVRPVGLRVDVLPLLPKPVNVQLKIIPSATYSIATLTPLIREKVADLLRYTPQRGYVLPVDIIKAAYAVNGVVSASLNLPASNTPCAVNEILTLGTFEVSAI